MKRERRQPDPGNYEDPLQNYDPPTHADEFERSLTEDALSVITSTPFEAVEGSRSVDDVIKEMADRNVACAVVTDEDGRPLGVLSERDVMNRIADDYQAAKSKPVSEFMTKDPIVVHDSDPPAHVMNVMDSGGFRHVPIVDSDNKLVGVIGARRVTKYLQQHFDDV